MAVDGGHPRFHQQEREKLDAIAGDSSTAIRPQHRRLHDPSVTFEEYYYYAQQTRAEEEVKASHKTGIFSIIFPSKNDGSVGQTSENVNKDVGAINDKKEANRMTITDEEWTNASQALRTASRGAIFYLITMDIFGPFGLPYALVLMG